MSTERAQLLVPLAQHPSPDVFLVARSAAGEQPTTLTAALVKVQSKKGLAKAISYADIAKGGTVRDDS